MRLVLWQITKLLSAVVFSISLNKCVFWQRTISWKIGESEVIQCTNWVTENPLTFTRNDLRQCRLKIFPLLKVVAQWSQRTFVKDCTSKHGWRCGRGVLLSRHFIPLTVNIPEPLVSPECCLICRALFMPAFTLIAEISHFLPDWLIGYKIRSNIHITPWLLPAVGKLERMYLALLIEWK